MTHRIGRRPVTGRRPAIVRDESGQVGGIEAVAFGLLILIGGVLLVANAWAVVDAKLAASTSARDAARTFAKAPTTDEGEATRLADSAARESLAQMGWSRRDISVVPEGPGYQRCALVRYVVSIPVPAFRLPFLSAGPPVFHVTARHTERVDPYRSGVPSGGAAPCAGGEIP